MRHKIISISQAKAKLLQLSRSVEEEGMAFLLTRDSKPVSVLVPVQDYEAMLETSEILADEETLSNLERALEDEKRGRIWARNKQGQWKRATVKRI